VASEYNTVGEFVIDSLLGEGGMGKVYRARQVALDRWVALKVLDGARNRKDFAARFYREARSAARLVHPNIIQIHTVGEHQGAPYFAMEFVEGVDLDRLIRLHPEPLTTDETVEIIRCVAKALAAAAEQGLIHRDIKPANIMLAKNGAVKVMDFGLAKDMSDDLNLTEVGAIVGTPAYMSPEQGMGKPADIRSDIYSLGCVLYACLCDRPPFAADGVAALIFQHAHVEPAAPSSVRPGAPPELEAICLKMLAKAPEARFQTPDEVLLALGTVPANLSLAETLLAKRVAAVTAASSRTAPPRPHPAAPQSGVPAASHRPEPVQTDAAPAVAARSARASLPTLITPAPNARPPLDAPLSPVPLARSLPAAPLSPVPVRPRAAGSDPRLPPQRASSNGGVAETGVRVLGMELRGAFRRLGSGHWTYKAELSACRFAEGLAAIMKAPPGERPSNLGDCLLCTKWNKRVGCALAYCAALEARYRYEGVKLVEEQAATWIGARRLDVAITLFDGYVKDHPADPEGYRGLARLYDHPDYKGTGKRRAIVLYRRFVELARDSGGFSELEITRAEERAGTLQQAPRETALRFAESRPALTFRCFYSGVNSCFAHGMLCPERLVVVSAGAYDPDTGQPAATMRGAKRTISTAFLRIRPKDATREELASVRTELARLSDLCLEELAADPACVANIACNGIAETSLAVADNAGVKSLTVRADEIHQLLFPKACAFEADQCNEFLRRRLAKVRA